jgi:hypothetical protein
MDRREMAGRVGEQARVQVERIRCGAAAPVWRRRDLARRLRSSEPGLRLAVDALERHDWSDAHRHLARHFETRPPRFVFHASAGERIREQIASRHPAAVSDATVLAQGILDGSYDLLGYRGLQFGHDGRIDWHLDPVSGRHAPRAFWADVPYLDPAFGDHKVIWELNRHQHWLMLGRAYWLTRDNRFKLAFVQQLESWMRGNPPLRGINWASSLELAFRAISWLSALELFVGDDASGESPWTVDLLLGLDRQLRHLERHLSSYFSPNTHLLGEGLALYVCGSALPELSRSARWRQVGREILLTEATRQVLPDGVHAERSTHYHRYALDFYLLALATARISGDADMARRIEPTVNALAEFMHAVSDEGARYPLIGDDDGGELFPIVGYRCGDAAATLGWAALLLNRPNLQPRRRHEAVSWLTALTGGAVDAADPQEGQRSATYPAGGYFISRQARSHMVFDAGRHGYMNGGHAHADALAITLAVDGQPLLVDSGTATYTMDSKRRDYLRSSQAHNTLTLDGRSQAEPRGPFHWRSTADAAPARIVCAPRFDYFEGWTSAYAPLVHERSVLALDDQRWIVADLVRGSGQHDAALHWHLHPDWTATNDGRGGVRLAATGGTKARFAVVGGNVEIVPAGHDGDVAWISPVYGRLLASTLLRCRTHRMAPFALATVIEEASSAAELNVRRLEVLSANEDQPALAVAAEVDGALAVSLFASGEREARTVIVDPRRVVSVTTDARMLHARVSRSGVLERVCAVDCALLHFEGARTVTISSGTLVHDLDVTFDSQGHFQVVSSRATRPLNVRVEEAEGSAVAQDADSTRLTTHS